MDENKTEQAGETGESSNENKTVEGAGEGVDTATTTEAAATEAPPPELTEAQRQLMESMRGKRAITEEQLREIMSRIKEVLRGNGACMIVVQVAQWQEEGEAQGWTGVDATDYARELEGTPVADDLRRMVGKLAVKHAMRFIIRMEVREGDAPAGEGEEIAGEDAPVAEEATASEEEPATVPADANLEGR